MLTSYGRSTVIKIVVVCLAGMVTAVWLPVGAMVLLEVLLLAFLLFTFYFFRDPERTPPPEERLIVAPADGKVILVQPHRSREGDEPSTLVSIFMSPFNVHVNRIPVGGKVTHLRHCPGEFRMAFDNACMDCNERMEIGIDNGEIEVRFSQVSGFLARRIVCALHRGELVQLGTRFGMIKFGSRADMILPPTASVVVTPGQKTRAGETVIARY